MAIEIEMTADVRNVIKALRNGETSLEELESKLGEVSDASTDAGREIASSTDDATDSIDKTTEAGSKLGDSLGDLGGVAKDVLRGDLGGAAESAAASLGALGAGGAVAGVIASEGIKLITSELQKQQEAADELARRIGAAYRKAAEDGRNFVDEAQIQSEVLDIIFGDDKTRRDQAKADAAELGLTLQEVARAQAGDQDALNTVLERSSALEAERKDRYSEYLTLRGGPQQQLDAQALRTAQDIVNRYTEQRDIQQENQQLADQFLASEQARNEEIQIANRLLGETPQSIPVKIDVDRSAIEAALQRRTLRIDVEGYNRTGVRII